LATATVFSCGGKKTETAKTTTAASAPAKTAGWKSGDTIYFDVPAKAGGGTDLYTRFVTAGMQEITTGINYVVTNYDTSEVGSQHAKAAKPDGKTVTLGACTNMDNYLSGHSMVNPNEDLAVIAKLHDGGPQAWIAASDAPYNNMKELADYINAHPGELTVGCALGGTSQLIWLNVFGIQGVADKVNYVQCSSEADKLTNVASKAINLGNCSINNALSYQQDGKLKVLGVIGPKGTTKADCETLVGKQLNDSFLTMPEQGIACTWDAGYYILAPKNTPMETRKAINEMLLKLNENKTFLDGLKKMATFGKVKSLEDSQADWDGEWQFQTDMMTKLGMNVHKK